MTNPTSTPHDPYAALRVPEFRAYFLASVFATIAIYIQEIVVAWQLWNLTRDPMALAFVGLAEAIPYISLGLFGGHLADRYEKRGIVLRALGVVVLCSVMVWLLLEVWAGVLSVNARLIGLYAILMVIGTCRGLYSPALSAMVPTLISKEALPNASTWMSTSWQSGAVIGPMAGGLLLHWLGVSGSLWMVIGLFLVAMLCLWTIRPRAVPGWAAKDSQSVWESLAEGLRYVRQHKIILYSISLDLFSVLFGGVVAILPIFATEVLYVGPDGLGLLRAAPAIGGVLVVASSAYWSPTGQAWRNLLWAVAGFGLATLIFAYSRNFWLSAFALFMTGATDGISMIIRVTILQVMPHEAIRGRVFAINGIFVSASNELGAFESGLAAKLLGTVNSVIAGGVMTLLIVLWVATQTRDLLTTKVAPLGEENA